MHFITDVGIKKIVKAAVEAGGWTAHSGKTHNKLRHISGASIPIPKSASDHRAYKNLQSSIKHIEAGTHKFCMKK